MSHLYNLHASPAALHTTLEQAFLA